MTKEQAEKVLEELNKLKPDRLNDEAKRLFEAIIKIADERDELKKKAEEQEKAIYRLNLGKNTPISSECCIVNVKDIGTVLSMLEEQNKIIDLMAEDIYGYQIECNRYFKDKKEVKQYFENKAKELLNK